MPRSGSGEQQNGTVEWTSNHAAANSKGLATQSTTEVVLAEGCRCSSTRPGNASLTPALPVNRAQANGGAAPADGTLDASATASYGPSWSFWASEEVGQEVWSQEAAWSKGIICILRTYTYPGIWFPHVSWRLYDLANSRHCSPSTPYKLPKRRNSGDLPSAWASDRIRALQRNDAHELDCLPRIAQGPPLAPIPTPIPASLALTSSSIDFPRSPISHPAIALSCLTFDRPPHLRILPDLRQLHDLADYVETSPGNLIPYRSSTPVISTVPLLDSPDKPAPPLNEREGEPRPIPAGNTEYSLHLRRLHASKRLVAHQATGDREDGVEGSRT